ncbi:MAG: shikimate kinase [Verrucomicrobiales bacterium]|nr:shikimate kinase [Verrucomicrobiales bacterium]HQZ26551.1 shikimate kinase [Verrucomicrobiales bacterium]
MNTTEKHARNLILIGFMGTGKTSVGMRVAKSLGMRFVDTDKLIVRKAGKPIPQIFAESGEDYFRELETEVLRKCAKANGQVISTGGGIVTQPRNFEILRDAGYVIWLNSMAETIYERVKRNRNRPLLHTEDPLTTIREMLEARKGLYEAASDLRITTDDLTMEETCYGVTESARLALSAA